MLHTLARICQGGIYDHLGGGFARYSVDAYWLVPHFEKMLYDNAQLLELLASAHAATGDALFAARAEETVAWLKREMLVDGAFASALDADSEGRRAGSTSGMPPRSIGSWAATRRAFRLAYGVTDAGNWEGHNVLNRLHEPGLPRKATPPISGEMPRNAPRRARAADPARPRRQGARRLERPDDRGPRPGVGSARPPRLARGSPKTPSRPSCAT